MLSGRYGLSILAPTLPHLTLPPSPPFPAGKLGKGGEPDLNIAARMESSSDADRVNISAYTYDLVRNEFDCQYRGKINAKGKGEMDMYFVSGAMAS